MKIALQYKILFLFAAVRNCQIYYFIFLNIALLSVQCQEYQWPFRAWLTLLKHIAVIAEILVNRVPEKISLIENILTNTNFNTEKWLLLLSVMVRV